MASTLTTRGFRPSAVRRSDAFVGFGPAPLAATGAVVTTDGVVGTFSRASTAWGIDPQGRLYRVPNATPTLHSIFDSSGVRVASGVRTGPSRPNLVTNPDSLTAASGWTVAGTTVPADNQGPFAGVPFTRFSVVTGGAVSRAVTLTGNGPKVVGWLLKADGSGVSVHAFNDTTASVNRARITATWVAGVLTGVTATTGTVRATQRLADGAYWVTVRTADCIAANAHAVFATDLSGATIPSVLVAGVTVSDATDLAVPYGQTAADTLRWPYLATGRTALTAYHDCVPLGSITDGSTLWGIGSTSTANAEPRLSVAVRSGAVVPIYRATTGVALFRFAAGDSLAASTFARTGEAQFSALESVSPSYGPAVGTRLRSLVQLTAAGGLTLTTYVGGATTPTTTVAVASDGLPPSWAGTTLAIGADTAGGNQPELLHLGYAIAPGVRTLVDAARLAV